jgi:glutathione S-transferase
VFKQPGNGPGIIADAHARLNRFLPVLDKQLEGRDFIAGPLSVVDFLIGPRLDNGPAFLNFDISPYRTSTPGSSGSARSPMERRVAPPRT